MKCPDCRTPLERTTVALNVAVPLREGTLRFDVQDVPGRTCANCGEVVYDGPSLGQAELVAALQLVDRGYREGAAFRFVRKALGYRAADLARLLGVVAETISRWENDRIAIDAPVWIAMGSLVSDKLAGVTTTVDRLLAAFEQHAIANAPISVSIAPERGSAESTAEQGTKLVLPVTVSKGARGVAKAVRHVERAVAKFESAGESTDEIQSFEGDEVPPNLLH